MAKSKPSTSNKAKAKSAASSSKKASAKAKKSTNTNKNNRKAAPPPPPSSKFLTCSETGEKVFVATATLADIQNPPTGSQRRKILFKIPSAKIRTQLYEELALCLEDRETRLLPKYGGRPWTVLCRVQDSSSKSSPFFRWFRGKLELAVLPHILDKIPNPPKFPGYVQTEYGVVRQLVKSDLMDSNNNSSSNNNNKDNKDEDNQYGYDNLTEEEIQRMESLQGRDISTLSQVAWDHRNDARHGAPLPTISIKWTCPLRQIFTTRKAAWDHALELAKAEQFVDRFLHGLGKHGAPLKPFRPSRAQALQAGKVRFLRDGLWVVGQEQNWQNERYLAMERQEQQQQQQQEEEAQAEADANGKKRQLEQSKAGDTTNGNSEPLRKRRKITGHALFLSLHRVAYREKRIKELSNKKVAHAKNEPERNHKNDNEEEDSKPAARSKTAAKVGLPSPPPPQKKKASKNNNNNKVSFTLGDAEKELRAMWKKKLSDEEKQTWETKAATSFQRKIDDDDEARWELARRIDEEEESEEESESGDESNEDDESEEGDQDTDGGPKEEEQSDGATDNSKEDGDDEESTRSNKLATEEERRLWEILSEAEQELWKARAFKDMLSNDGKPTLSRPIQRSVYSEYQRRVYDSFIGMSPEEYELYSTRDMKASDKRKHLKELGHLKELILDGMKLIGPKAHAVLEKRIEKWVTGGIQNANQAAKRREQAKKAAAAPQPSSDISGPLSTTSPKRIAVDPPGVTFEGANAGVGAKQDDEAEMKTLSNQSGSITLHRSPATTAQPDSQFAVASTPISPSPTLVEPMAALHNDTNISLQAPETLATGSGTHQNCTLETSDEKAKAETIASNAVAAAAAASLPDDASSSEDEEESDKEDEIVEVPRFIPTEHFCLNDEQIKLCTEASMEHFDAVMRTVKAKDLTRELVDGFDVLRERGRGRYDMELPVFDTQKFDFINDINKAPWMPIVRQVLGDDVVLIHKGCFLSLPDAANQVYHQDGTHLTSQTQRPCHAVNVFTPLVDMTMRHGPTEFCLGSHVLGQEDWDRRFIETPLPKKGVPVMFDYRLGHRGLANTSKEPRPIVYCTYARARDGKEFRDSVNFSRKRYRKLGEIVEKPLSREERSEKRKVYRGL